jgi:hypothetical protein
MNLDDKDSMNKFILVDLTNDKRQKIFSKSLETARSLITWQKGKWLRTSELAHYLGTTEGSIRNMVYRGQLVPRRFNRRNYFSVHEVDKLIEASRIGGPNGN